MLCFILRAARLNMGLFMIVSWYGNCATTKIASTKQHLIMMSGHCMMVRRRCTACWHSPGNVIMTIVIIDISQQRGRLFMNEFLNSFRSALMLAEILVSITTSMERRCRRCCQLLLSAFAFTMNLLTTVLSFLWQESIDKSHVPRLPFVLF